MVSKKVVPMHESALVAACIRGEAAAWEKLIRQYQDRMAAAAAAALKRVKGRADPADVQDVCQAVLTSLWIDDRRRLRSYQGSAPLATWLAVICARTALNHIRTDSRKDGKRFGSISNVSRPTPDSLQEYLGRLPPRQRAAVVLRYYEGMRSREIADALGIQAASVTSTIGRAMRELRRVAARVFPSR